MARGAFIGAVIQGAGLGVWEVRGGSGGFMGYQMCVGCGKVKVIGREEESIRRYEVKLLWFRWWILIRCVVEYEEIDHK